MPLRLTPREWERLGASPEPHPARELLRQVRIGLVGLNVAVVVLVGTLLWQFWKSELRGAEQQAAASAAQLQRSIDALLDEVGVSVKYAGLQAQLQLSGQGLDSPAFWTMMELGQKTVPALQRMGIFDARGHRLCNPRDKACRQYDISDRDYFALLRQRPGLPPTLFGPIQAKPSGEPSLVMAKAINTRGAAFAGAIVAVVPVSKLQPLLMSANAGEQGVTGIRTEALDLIIGVTGAHGEPASTTDADATEILRQSIARTPTAGSYRTAAAADGVDRIVAYQKLPGYPIYATVGRAVNDVTGAWRVSAAWALGLMLLLFVASVVIDKLVKATLDRQAQARALYDAAPCGYHSLDVHGRYISINATELGWLGCKRGQVIGNLSLADFLTEDGVVALALAFEGLKRTGRLDQLELDLIGRQGIRRRVVVTAIAVADSQGAFLKSNSVMHDITALNEARAELAERAQEQQAILDTELVGMVKVKASVITWANPGMDHIFGYARGDWVGMPVSQLFQDESSFRQAADRIGQLRHGDDKFHAELELRRKDGSPAWVDASTVKFDPSEAESLTIVKVITDRKKAETERLRAVELEAQNQVLRDLRLR